MNVGNDERTLCEVWCRVMGYFRPVACYNAGKRSEFYERVKFQFPTVSDNSVDGKSSDRQPNE